MQKGKMDTGLAEYCIEKRYSIQEVDLKILYYGQKKKRLDYFEQLFTMKASLENTTTRFCK